MLPERIKKTGQLWDKGHNLYSDYQRFAKGKFYKIDLFNKLDEGYEMFSIGCDRLLTTAERRHIQYLFKVIAYEATKIRKQKPNIMLELRTYHCKHSIKQKI